MNFCKGARNVYKINGFVLCQTEGHRGPRNEVGSLSPAECLGGLGPETF